MIIYKVTNIINGKIYIGQTIRSLEARWKDHCSSREKFHFQNSIQKYGKESFTVEQIDSASSLQELNSKEIYWINYYDSINNGYNKSLGGKNSKLTSEHKSKIGSANKGKKRSEECKKGMSERNKGNKICLGRKLSEETKAKIKKSWETRERGTRVITQEFRDKMREIRKQQKGSWNKGKHLSDELKKKISDGNKGKIMSDEAKRKISESKKGKKGHRHSDSTKKKLSEARVRFLKK